MPWSARFLFRHLDKRFAFKLTERTAITVILVMHVIASAIVAFMETKKVTKLDSCSKMWSCMGANNYARVIDF